MTDTLEEDRLAGLDDDELEDDLPETDADLDDETSDVESEDYALTIDADLPPAKKMLILGEEYELKSMDHLSPDEEAKVSATFARFLNIYQRLAISKTDQKATAEAMRLRKLRMKLILLMTTIPRGIVERMGAGAQGKILKAIQEEIGAEVEDDVGEVDLGE